MRELRFVTVRERYCEPVVWLAMHVPLLGNSKLSVVSGTGETTVFFFFFVFCDLTASARWLLICNGTFPRRWHEPSHSRDLKHANVQLGKTTNVIERRAQKE